MRNSVGLDWHPDTGEMWWTDNGRDNMGENVPDDELNRVTTPGEDFGFPSCHCRGLGDPENRSPGASPDDVVDTSADSRSSASKCQSRTSCVQAMGPHVAAVGMT